MLTARRTHRSRAAVAAISASIAATAGLAAPTAAASPTTAAPADYSTPTALNAAAAEVATFLQENGLADLAGYGGIRITTAGVEIDSAGMNLSALAPLIATARFTATELLAGVPGASTDGSVPILVREVPHTYAWLMQMVTQLSQDRPFWLSQKVEIGSWGPELSNDTVQIRLNHYTTEAAQALIAHYGDDLVSVFPESSPFSGSSDRSNDSAPWYGGDYVNIDGGSTYCTTYFGVTSGSTSYVLTAGHCGGTSLVLHGNRAVIGTIYASNFQNGGTTDLEVVRASAGSTVWADPTVAQRAVTQEGVNTPGTYVCTDGASDREVCSVYIEETGVSSVYEDGKLINNLVNAANTQNHAAFTPGDSGGPVYIATPSGSATAMGIDRVARANQRHRTVRAGAVD